ncbi:MAG: hypothetical protein L3K06_07480, partial [Thermoplasmata archaeon]|nr:hypothetical protein [Thermoplasmata archaeon]
IADAERRDEETFWAAFDLAAPRILGVLLDGVACAQHNVDSVKLPASPRMADFAKWISAAEPGLGLDPGTLLAAYDRSRTEAVDVALEASPVASALRELLAEEPKHSWTGTLSNLADALAVKVPDVTRRSPAWPSTTKALGSHLRRAQSFLRRVGVHMAELPDHSKGKRWTFYSSPPERPANGSARSDGSVARNSSDGTRTEHGPTGRERTDSAPSTDGTGDPTDRDLFASVRTEHRDSGSTDPTDATDRSAGPSRVDLAERVRSGVADAADVEAWGRLPVAERERLSRVGGPPW